jgi:hypothetical protein
VVNSSREVHLRWLERVVGREVNGQEEDAALEWRVAGSHYRCLPVKLCMKSVSALPIIKPRRRGRKSFEDGKVMSEMGFEYHIPGHLPWVLLSMMKAGRYTYASQYLFIIVLVALSRAMVCPRSRSHPRSRLDGKDIIHTGRDLRVPC